MVEDDQAIFVYLFSYLFFVYTWQQLKRYSQKLLKKKTSIYNYFR